MNAFLMLSLALFRRNAVKSVDLRTCVPGQKLRSKHGLILTYVGYEPEAHFPHIVAYPGGSLGSRIDDGHVYRNPEKRLPEDHDIVEILPVEDKR